MAGRGEHFRPEQEGTQTIRTGWIDTAGRTRTWALIDSKDGKLAEFTTKRGAEALKSRLDTITGHIQAKQVACKPCTRKGLHKRCKVRTA